MHAQISNRAQLSTLNWQPAAAAGFVPLLKVPLPLWDATLFVALWTQVALLRSARFAHTALLAIWGVAAAPLGIGLLASGWVTGRVALAGAAGSLKMLVERHDALAVFV